MIKVFYGDDRERARREIVRWLGTRDYELVEGAELAEDDLVSLFMGASLLAGGERKILIRDFLNNDVAEKLVDYLETPHRVAILEAKLDKRRVGYKALKGKVEMQEFAARAVDRGKIFEVYRVAKRDGARAVEMLRELEATEEPKAMIGALASQAMKDYAMSESVGARRSYGAAEGSDTHERRVLRELAKVDMKVSSAQRPWLYIEGFLVRMKGL